MSHDAVGAEGGDDVVGPAVVERLGVRGDRGADALGDVGEGRRRAHASESAQKPMSTIGRSSGFTLTSLQRREQLLVGEAGEEAVDGPFEVRDVSLGPLRQAHVLEALRVQALLLPRQVREVLRGDRRPPWIVALPHLGRRGLRPARSPSGNRVSDQISISVSSGPSGRKR